MMEKKEQKHTLRYGLIGERLSHSHSPALHALLAPYAYALFEMPEAEVAPFIRAPDIGGLNVTIPYKKTVVPLCDTLSREAAQIGSVNTLVYEKDGTISGHNTDYAGFVAMLRRAGIALRDRKILILGTGGTGVTARQVVMDQGAAEMTVLSRTGENTYDTLHCHLDSEVIINTTPVGMSPDLDGSLLSLSDFQSLRAVVDVIYNPLRTRLLLQASALGIRHTNGLPMLVYQAARAAELFTGDRVSAEKAEAALSALRAKVENIVLIGMPGCGKTVVGAALARYMGRELVDTDALVERVVGMRVPDILRQQGEAAFRALEEEAVYAASRRSGVVIATGGGAVLSARNRIRLSQNGRVYFLDRPLAKLARKGRPLSADIGGLAEKRMPIYREMCDVLVANDQPCDIESVARRIMEEFHENACH